MSQYLCRCRAVISDNSPDSGTSFSLFEDEHFHGVRKKASERIVAFLLKEDREEFLERFFGSDYPRDMEEADVVDDILCKTMLDSQMDVIK